MATGHGNWRSRSGRSVALAGALGVGLLGLVGPGVAPAAPGDILVADLDAFGDAGGGVIRVDPATGARTTVSANGAPAGGPDLADPFGLALEADGDILVTDPDAIDVGGRVVRVDPATGARTIVSANGAPAGGPDLAEPFGLALEADGDILVTDPDTMGGNESKVIRVDPATGARTMVSANTAPPGGPDLANPWAVALEADGGIVVADGAAFGFQGAVIRIDPVTGERTTVSANGAPAGGPNFGEPGAVAVEADGNILVADDSLGGRVIRVDPATGERTTVSANNAPPGGPDFSNPFGLALEADGDILVTDYDAFGGGGGVIRVDPATGARTLVSANGAPPGGPEFVNPFGVAVVPPPRPPAQPPPDRPRPALPPAGPTGPAQPGCPVAGNVIEGSDGDDERSGGALSDIIFGALGDDLLRGLGGPDCLYGQQGADRLLGGRGRDRLFGGRGADRLGGGAGNDRLRDRRGRDRLAGRAGRDRLRAGRGPDRVFGGSGRDLINPGRGSDRVAAGAGNDRVLARGLAPDRIDCGPGPGDVAIVDARDDTTRCEQVRLP